MVRAIKCVKFQSIRLIESTAVITAIFLAAYVALIAVISFIPKTGSTNMNFCFVALFIAFILNASLYSNTFNNLLMFGNTRKTILTSFSICGAALAAVLAVLSELGELLSFSLSHVFRFVRTSGLEYIYNGLNPFGATLWFFTLFLVLVMIGYLYGALGYRFGKIFKMVFWIGGGILSGILSSLISISGVFSAVVNGAKSFFGYHMTNGVYWCSLHFFIVALLLFGILWLIVRRQPQKG